MYLAVDDEPITKLQICQAALESKLFLDTPLPQFQTNSGPIGKRLNGELTRKLLNWQPRYPSFRKYMRAVGGVTGDEPVATKPKEKSLLWLPGDDDDDM